jgi:hypothetical protein
VLIFTVDESEVDESEQVLRDALKAAPAAA